jgi:pantoate--beta-alanine ligase
MRVARSIAELTEMRGELDDEAKRVAFVATMGALHAGHLSLVRLAREHADVVVVSIFVNPLQFGPGEDYARYPRPLEDDLVACRRAGVDLVFVPSVTDFYPAGRQVTVSAGGLGSVLEGRSRPGHFDGVLTVVLKLLNLVRPHVAVFGEKDAQQLACIRRMATDLNLGVEVVGAPIVREPDGLAMSSRNRFLTPVDRSAALALCTALRAAASEDTVDAAVEAARAVLAESPGLTPDYAALVHPVSFAEVLADFVGEARLVLAATVGQVRLIDNAAVTVVPAPVPTSVE